MHIVFKNPFCQWFQKLNGAIQKLEQLLEVHKVDVSEINSLIPPFEDPHALK
jgi:hypothetical protein